MISDEINQICFVFRDISTNIEIYKKLIKFSSEINVMDVKVNKNIFKEKIEPFKIRLALTKIGNTQIEFIQPLEGKSIYKNFLEEKGGGLHHVGFFVKNIEEAMKSMEAKDIKQLINMNVLGVKCAYYDTMDKFGHHVEIIEVKII